MSPSATVVTSVHQPDDPRILYRSIGTLVADGWDVTYVCRPPGPSSAGTVSISELRGGRASRALHASFVIVSAKTDVVVAHDPELLPAVIVASLLGKTVVFDVHENIPAQLAARSRTPSLLRIPSSRVVGWLLRLASRVGVVTLAEPGYANLVEGEAPVFENFPQPAALPTRTDDGSGVVYVGDITEARGATLLVEAVGSLDPAPRLTMIGRCSEDLARSLSDAAERSEADLVLTGFLPYDDAWALAATHLVGVSPLLDTPNYRHSLPTKLLEYRSVGLVVVASDLPGSRDVLADSQAAVGVPPGDVEALAEAIAEAVSNQTRADAALAEVDDVRRRSWDADGFASFYRGLIDDRR